VRDGKDDRGTGDAGRDADADEDAGADHGAHSHHDGAEDAEFAREDTPVFSSGMEAVTCRLLSSLSSRIVS
jgi:hypothetical protein